MLQSIGVLSVPSVGWPTTRLHIGCIPGLRPDGTQKSGRVESARANLQIKRLYDDTTALGPEILEPPGELLKSHCHGFVLFTPGGDSVALMQSGIVSEFRLKENKHA